LRWDSLLDTAKGHAVSAPEKFLMQALVGSKPDEKSWNEGNSKTFYFYHHDAWQPADARWSRLPERKGKPAQGADRPPVQMLIATQTPNLGTVKVDLTLDRRGSRLDFRNERHDARALLANSLPPLERLLSDLDLRLASWTYAPLPPSQAPENLTTPPLMGSGPTSQLDLFG
jgi:hypothetical protein